MILVKDASVKLALSRVASGLKNAPTIRLVKMIPTVERQPTHRNPIDPSPEVVREVHSAINKYLYEG